MKNLYIGSFEQETLPELLKEINEISQEKKFRVVLDTNGGSALVMEVLVEILLDLKDNIEVIGLGIHSAGFTLFQKLYNGGVKCKLTQSSFSIYHKTGWDVKFAENQTPRGSFEKFKYEVMKKIISSTEFMSKEELEIFNSGEDIYFDYDRLIEIFPKAK